MMITKEEISPQDIIEMARQSELIMPTDCTTPWIEDYDLTPHLETFAKLIAQRERKACEKIADDIHLTQGFYENGQALQIADAIRARGNQECCGNPFKCEGNCVDGTKL